MVTLQALHVLRVLWRRKACFGVSELVLDFAGAFDQRADKDFGEAVDSSDYRGRDGL